MAFDGTKQTSEAMLSESEAKRALITQGKPVLLPEMEEAAIEALRSDKFLRGENVIKFEEEFAQFVGTKHAVALSSGTAALDFVFMALGLSGKGVVTSTWSFIASANTIMHAGATPLLTDISDSDYCLNPSDVEGHLKNGAKAILPVHIYGHPVDWDRFQELGERYGVPLVEDACQAHGATYKGRSVGSLGIAAAFSFYPSKNMTVLGDGGMLTTNDSTLAAQVSKMRDAGRRSEYEHDVMGYTARMNSVNAAIGRVQLKHLRQWNERRREIADKYFRQLADTAPSVGLPPRRSRDLEPVYHQYVIRTSHRDELRSRLLERRIQTGIHYPIPIHLQPLYLNTFGYKEGTYPHSEALAKECLSLPMHPFLSDDDVDYVCEEVAAFFERRRA